MSTRVVSLMAVVLVVMSGSVFASFTDGFEGGVGNWDYSYSGESLTAVSGGNPGNAGEYSVGLANGGVFVNKWASAWNSQLSYEVAQDTHVTIDMKVLEAGAAYTLSRNMTSIWTVGDRQGISMALVGSDLNISVLGSDATVPTFTSATMPAGVAVNWSGWNRYEIISDAGQLTIKINGGTLWSGAAKAGSDAFGTPGLRTGWTGHALLDNVSAALVVPEPVTAVLLLSGLGCLIRRKK